MNFKKHNVLLQYSVNLTPGRSVGDARRSFFVLMQINEEFLENKHTNNLVKGTQNQKYIFFLLAIYQSR